MSTVESLADEILNLIPGAFIRNKATSTSSIYIKTPDGYSLRVGDHNGREKYKYKWNLGMIYANIRGWRKDGEYWRYYTDRPLAIAMLVERNTHECNNSWG
jgi:hypothetical protein